MTSNSSGPHILLFERDQQLTTLLAGELALAGYKVHTAFTAVEVFDAMARFPVRLVMVDLAQVQASRREFWVALDTQRRGRDVQVFTFRCTNLAGYGPDDPDERIQAAVADLEVDGMTGVVKLVSAIRTRVPILLAEPEAPARPAQVSGPLASVARPAERFQEPPDDSWPVDMATTPRPVPNGIQANRAQSSLRLPQQTREAPTPPNPSARPAEAQRPAASSFTDKIRAVIYPNSRNFSPMPESSWTSSHPAVQPQNAAQYQDAEAQARPQQASQRFAEADYASGSSYEETGYRQSTRVAGQPRTPERNAPLPPSGPRYADEESSLDQLSRLLRESQPSGHYAAVNGNAQAAPVQPASGVTVSVQQSPAQQAPGLSINPQEIQELRSQITQAARMDEAARRANPVQARPSDEAAQGVQLRASPIHDAPFEREADARRVPSSNGFSAERFVRASSTVLPPTQSTPVVQPVAGEAATTDYNSFVNGAGSVVQPVPVPQEFAPEIPVFSAVPPQESVDQGVFVRSGVRESFGDNGLGAENQETLVDQVQISLAQGIPNRPDFRTTDDTLLDIVKSLPPMAPAPQPPQVLSGRATRSLGSVLLEGHLVPQERLQVAQHVQRMLRGVDLNYQLGEILLMFKLLTPDQLLAASLLSYGMISTTQISALGRIRQELYSIGLEYDLESLLVLFRILSPEQLREVRASWSS